MSFSKSVLFYWLFFIVTATAQETDDRISILKVKYEQALSLAAEPLTKFDNRYLGELAELQKTVQKRGALEAALLIEAEIKEYQESKDRDYSGLPELLRLRKIYEENRSRLEKDVLSHQIGIHHQSSQKFGDLSVELTKDGNLPGALKSKEIQDTIKKAIETAVVLSSNSTKLTFSTKVPADRNARKPLETGVNIVAGQTFRFVPNPTDKWTGGGSKRGVYCNYLGYPKSKVKWMRLHYQIGDSKPIPVEAETIQTSSSNGVIKLFTEDGSAAGNTGYVRVEIILNPDQKLK